MTATVTRTTKTVINLSSNTTILFTNIATEDARKTTIFSNRFINFKIQLQKILSLLVLAIERQLKLKCRYHTWTPVVTLERVTLHLLTFWHFDTRNGFSVPGSGSGGSRGGTGGGGGLPIFLYQIEDRRANKFFFEPAPPPLISGCGWFPPYLKVFIRHQEPITRRHWVGWLNSDLKYLLQVLPFSSRRFSTVHADFIAHSLFRSSALTAYVKKKDPFKNLAYRNVVI